MAIAKFNIFKYISQEKIEEQKSIFQKRFLLPLNETKLVPIKGDERKAYLYFIYNQKRLGRLTFNFNGKLSASKPLLDGWDKIRKCLNEELVPLLEKKYPQFNISWEDRTGLIAFLRKKANDPNPDYKITFDFNLSTGNWNLKDEYLKKDELKEKMKKANKK